MSYDYRYFYFSPKALFQNGFPAWARKKNPENLLVFLAPAPPRAAAVVVYARKIEETDDEASGNSGCLTLNAPNIINVQV